MIQPAPGPVRFTLLYLLVGCLWIFFSDQTLLLLGLSLEQLARLQLVKGLAFILLTGALLYLILRSHLRQQQHNSQALQASEERLQLAILASRDGMWDWDVSSNRLLFSPRFAEMLGLSPDQLGNDAAHWIERLHPDERPQVLQKIREVLRNPGEHFEHCYRLRHSDGSYRWLLYRGQAVSQSSGLRFIGTCSDITEQRHYEDSLRQAAAVFDSTQEGVLVSNAQHEIVHVNPAFTQITGYSEAEVLGQNPRLLKSGRHDQAFYQSLWSALEKRGAWSGEIWNRRKNGQVFAQWQNIRVVKDAEGQVTHYVAVFSDLSAIRRSQRELEYLAHHDPLTNLPNRLLLNERTTHCLERILHEGGGGALLLLDLDHFKHVNESLGHNAGDLLLKAISDRLSSQLQPGMTLARMGGDEFALLVEDCAEAEQAALLARRLLDCLKDPFELVGHTLVSSGSIGICLFPGDAQSVEQVLRNADSALFKAKSNGRENYAFYSQELTAHAQRWVELGASLRHALEQGELRVHYQPIIDLASGALLGVESLVRWQHPQRGLVPPGEFIPIAEESGLIGAIDAWVLREACQQMQRWQAAGLAPTFIAVNVSSRLFCRGELDQQVARVLGETGLAADCLELEVTESAVMEDADSALALMQRLRALGVRLSIDDFGTGYSSLLRLKRLPVQKLKIDQGFVAGLPANSEDAAIARAVIALAHSMGLRVVAEGIERPEQAEFLLQHQCDYGQGYLFGRPQPADSLLPIR